MKCPLCQVELQMTERQGIEIDYCPQCRGVWLDRGELDKLIERSTSAQFGMSPPSRGEEVRERDDDHDKGYPPHKQKKKESFWSELFDFG